ncbi:TlpA family protein disulfide reductase [Sphingobacterium lumbrici]|uniref:TlpA family protein disulfide reductase n=1 Tax=Sphingobacterium lumbrici TaxID=2559600 RepID=UPI001C11741A|nr:TlpA family protein disulfide reductase [Sphingobacterium lumbrici]
MKTKNLIPLSLLVLFLAFGVSLKAQEAKPADKIEQLKGLVPLDPFKTTPEQDKSFDIENSEEIYFEDGSQITLSDLARYTAGIDYIKVSYVNPSDRNTVLAILVRKCTPDERQALKLIKEAMGWEDFPGGVDPNAPDLSSPDKYMPLQFDPNRTLEDALKGLTKKPAKLGPGIVMFNPSRTALYDEKGKFIPYFLPDGKTPNPTVNKYLNDANFSIVHYKDETGLIKVSVFVPATLAEKKGRGQTVTATALIEEAAASSDGDNNGGSMQSTASFQQKVITPEGVEGVFAIGKKADDFTAKDINGADVSLSQYKGKKVVVLNFWFTRCKPCVAEMPLLNKLVEQYKGKDVEFISLCNDDEKTINEFLKTHKFDYRIVANTLKLANKYKITGFPTSVVIDKDSKVSFFEMGGSDKIGEHLKKAIDSVLK